MEQHLRKGIWKVWASDVSHGIIQPLVRPVLNQQDETHEQLIERVCQLAIEEIKRLRHPTDNTVTIIMSCIDFDEACLPDCTVVRVLINGERTRVDRLLS